MIVNFTLKRPIPNGGRFPPATLVSALLRETSGTSPGTHIGCDTSQAAPRRAVQRRVP